MYYGEWNKSIDTLIHHLGMKNATWRDERAASMRFIARCYRNLNRLEEARMWLKKAILESPHLRDAYLELALLELNEKNYLLVNNYCKKALKININNRTYINEIFTFDETIYDLLSVSNYYLGNYKEALYYINEAIKINKNNDRINKNKNLIIEQIELSN